MKSRLLKSPEVRLEYERLTFCEAAATALREARESEGLTQAEVARLAGTTQSVIARLESGRGAGPSLPLLDRVSRALGWRVSLRLERLGAA